MSDTVEISSLVEHEAFLRAIARGLLRDAGQAEDVVQDAYVAALERRPRAEGLRGWLATVTRNLAVSRWRSQSRRTARERAVAQPEAEPAVAEAVSRLEIQRRVADAVLRLDEPYRSTVLLRFFYGHSMKEVATRQRVPLNTARSRLQRALAKLREDLDRRPGGRSAWCLALAPLALRRPAAATGLLVAGAALLVVAAAAVLPRGDAPRDREGHASASLPPDPLLRDAVEVETAGGAGEPVTVDAARVLVRGTLTAAQPLVGPARVRVRPAGVDDFDVQAESGAQVEVDVTALVRTHKAEALDVFVDHPDHLVESVPVRLGEPPFRIALRRAGVVTGQVLGDDGRPVRARVGVFPLRDGKPQRDPAEFTRTGGDGRFRLRVGAEGSYLVVAARFGLTTGSVMTDLWVGRTVELAPLQLRRGATIEGRVRRIGEARTSSFHVHATAAGDSHHFVMDQNGFLVRPDGVVERADVGAEVEADGRYRIGGLVPGAYEVFAQLEDGDWGGWSGDRARRLVDAPVAAVDFEFDQVAVDVLVLSGEETLAGARVELERRTIWNRNTDARGRVRWKVVPSAQYRLRVSAPGHEAYAATLEAPPSGTTKEHVVALAPATTARLRIALDGAELPPTVRVALYDGPGRPMDETLHEAELTLAGGAVTWPKLRPGRWLLVVRPGGPLSYCLPARETVTLLPDATTDVTLAVRRGGRLRVDARPADGRTNVRGINCYVAPEDGEPLAIRLHKRGGSGNSTIPAGPGPAEIDPPLAPGVYRVAVALGGEVWTQEARVELGRTTDVKFVLR